MSRHRSGEGLVFSLATLLILVHALDDALVHRQPGVGIGQHALAVAVTLGAAMAGAIAFPFLRPGLRAWGAFGFGALALVNGALHVRHLQESGAGASDISGALAAVAGAALVGLAIWIPWRHRGRGAATPRKRWALRVLVVPAGLITAFLTVVPIGMAIVETHKHRTPIGAPPSAAYEEIAFEAADGVDIAGWYRPSDNGAAVLVAHGGGSDRKGSVAHAEMLARHGYGVLLYDARGRGESEGGQNAYGWDWGKDIDGALTFLHARPDVEPERIGALGLSTGADVLIEVAARRDDLHAVVGDGAAAASFEDWRRLQGTSPMTPFLWMEFAAVRTFAGNTPGPPLEELVTDISSPLLLISAGPGPERQANARYEALARGPVEHWSLPDAHHTRAIHEHPEEYERRVVSFLDEALG
jgi:uncharacterized protein